MTKSADYNVALNPQEYLDWWKKVRWPYFCSYASLLCIQRKARPNFFLSASLLLLLVGASSAPRSSYSTGCWPRARGRRYGYRQTEGNQRLAERTPARGHGGGGMWALPWPDGSWRLARAARRRTTLRPPARTRKSGDELGLKGRQQGARGWPWRLERWRRWDPYPFVSFAI
jgi:hypothetical protein